MRRRSGLSHVAILIFGAGNPFDKVRPMARKFRPCFGVIGPLAVVISCCISPLLAAAIDTLPALGTDAETIQQYDATVEDAARPLRWNLSFMKYDQSLNTRMFDGLVQRGVTHIVVTVGLEHSLADIASGELGRRSAKNFG
jgi:hypothetical protein